jgi:hypothetical protein
MAADVSPDEVLMHMQALGEEYNVPSIFVQSRYLLGKIAATVGATAVVLLHKERPTRGKKDTDKPVTDEYKERYATLADMMVRLNSQLHYKQPGFVSKFPANVPHPSWINFNHSKDEEHLYDPEFIRLMKQETMVQALVADKEFETADLIPTN